MKSGEPLYIWLTAKRCANEQPYSAWVTPAGGDAARATLHVGVELDQKPGETCARRFKVYGFSFPEPGSYDPHFVLGKEASAPSQHFVVRYDVTETGASGRDTKWQGEPAGSRDWCNDKPCNKVIEGILLDSARNKGGSFSLSRDMGRTAIATLTIHPRSTRSPLAGTFEISHPAGTADESAVEFRKGEFAIRKGRLALRSADGEYRACLAYTHLYDTPSMRWFDVLLGAISVNLRLEIDGSLFPCCLPRSSEPL